MEPKNRTQSSPFPVRRACVAVLAGSLSAAWIVLAACSGPEVEAMTESSGSTTTDAATTISTTTISTTTISTTTSPTAATAASATSSEGTEATGSGATEVTSEGTTSDGTDSSTTGGTTEDTSTTDGDTDTGSGVCEAALWELPEASTEELAAHDLGWIPCDYSVCGPDDAEPGQTMLCADFSLDGVPLEYLGFVHPNDSGAFTTDDVISEQSIAWLNSPRHVYRYDASIYILTELDDVIDQLDVYFTVRALEVLRLDHAATYEALLVDTAAYPEEPILDGLGWKNRNGSYVISFDTSPLYIAAGLTVLDQAPVFNEMEMYTEYSNVPAISIDRETILGVSEEIGSRPIYNKPGDDENFLRYAREGLAETLIHELGHRYIDRLNSVDAAMKGLYDRRVDPDACAKWELEEVLVASASQLHFRKAGGVGDTYLDYYDVVLDANLAVVKECPDYAEWAETFASPSGVHERYDLRLLDLE